MVVGAIVGQVSAVVSTVVTGRRDRTGAQEKRRREAYAAFIDATQGILQSVRGLPPIEQTRQGTVTDRTLEEVAKLQRAWATVVIVGTMAAWDASNVVKDAASRIARVFCMSWPMGSGVRGRAWLTWQLSCGLSALSSWKLPAGNLTDQVSVMPMAQL